MWRNAISLVKSQINSRHYRLLHETSSFSSIHGSILAVLVLQRSACPFDHTASFVTDTSSPIRPSPVGKRILRKIFNQHSKDYSRHPLPNTKLSRDLKQCPMQASSPCTGILPSLSPPLANSPMCPTSETASLPSASKFYLSPGKSSTHAGRHCQLRSLALHISASI